MEFDQRNLMKAITSLAIEKVLADMGKPVLDKVSNKLKKEHNCYIPDCYDYPEYLSSILRTMFGNASRAIVQSINSSLSDYMYDNGVRVLVSKISE